MAVALDHLGNEVDTVEDRVAYETGRPFPDFGYPLYEMPAGASFPISRLELPRAAHAVKIAETLTARRFAIVPDGAGFRVWRGVDA